MRIRCDLDGVLVNMEEYIKQHLSADAADDKTTMWNELAMEPRFYRKMRATSYAKRLWAAIIAIDPGATILSALPRKDTIPHADEDKRYWVANHKNRIFNGSVPDVETCLYSANKWKHCTGPDDVLIDDKRENCEDWKRAGGIAVHHTGNVSKTIKKLQEVARLMQ